MTVKERLMQIAQGNADEAKDQADNPRYEDVFASYLINALDTLSEEGIPAMFRPQLVALYIAAYGPVSYKVINVPVSEDAAEKRFYANNGLL